MPTQELTFSITRPTNAAIIEELRLLTDYLGYEVQIEDPENLGTRIDNPESRLQYFKRKNKIIWRSWRKKQKRQELANQAVDDPVFD